MQTRAKYGEFDICTYLLIFIVLLILAVVGFESGLGLELVSAGVDFLMISSLSSVVAGL